MTKNLTATFLLLLLLTSCASATPTPQIVEVTRIVEVTPAASPQPSPTAQAASMLFPVDCLARQPGIDYWVYDWLKVKSIGGCGYISPSPNGRYLAYSMLACLNESECGEAVKILEVGSSEPVTIQFMPKKEKKWVWRLDWSADGQLAVSYININNGAGVYIFREPFLPSLEEGRLAAGGGISEWNASHTAFVSFGATGEGSCDTFFDGYDFTSGKAFPDIASLLGLAPYEVNVVSNTPGSPPSNWWNGDSIVLVLVTPLKYDETQSVYQFMPTMAGRIVLTPSGPEYTTLASSDTENFYFEKGTEGMEVRSKPYEPRYCNMP